MSDIVSDFSQKASSPKHCLQIKVCFLNLPYSALQNLPQVPLQLPLPLITHVHWYFKHTI